MKCTTVWPYLTGSLTLIEGKNTYLLIEALAEKITLEVCISINSN